MGRQSDNEETVEAMETMSAMSNTATARTEQREDLAALAARWPQFSAAELRRLRFLAYRRATGRLRPPRPLRTAGACVCEEIGAYLRTPPPAPPVRDAAALGVPPLWRAWMAAQGSAHYAHSPRI